MEEPGLLKPPRQGSHLGAILTDCVVEVPVDRPVASRQGQRFHIWYPRRERRGPSPLVKIAWGPELEASKSVAFACAGAAAAGASHLTAACSLPPLVSCIAVSRPISCFKASSTCMKMAHFQPILPRAHLASSSLRNLVQHQNLFVPWLLRRKELPHY